MSKKSIKQKPTEEGNIIDQLGSIIVMVFIFAMILAYAAYGSSVQKRLNIDNVAKKYLYIMEQNGYLDEGTDKKNMEEELANYGVTALDFGTTTMTQVAYGDKVVLDCTVEFPNPLYAVFENGAVANIPGFPATITYKVYMTATSKW